MSDFHHKFEEFQEKYTEERGTIVAINSVNLKSQTDLRDQYTKLILAQYLLNRINLLSVLKVDQPMEDMVFLLKDLVPVSVANTLKLFSKTVHKDRFSYLIHMLINNPEVFAQMIYFFQVLDIIPPNDKIFFLFSTFPAIYSSFSTLKEQDLAISVINNLFLIHHSLHGRNYSMKFKFLSDICFSYFLSTNPGQFFGVLLKPIIREFKEIIVKDQFEYTLIDNRLSRRPYWTNCLIFAIKLISRMVQCISLLPDPAIMFLQRLSGDSFSNIFIFESTICNFLENPIFCTEAATLHDVCQIIRCSYPQNIFPSPIYKDITDSSLLDQVKLDIFFNAVKQFEVSKTNDNLSHSIDRCDRYFVVSPRDLHVVYSMTKTFLVHVENRDEVKSLNDHFLTLSNVTTPNDHNSVLLIKIWATSGDRNDIKLRPTKNFDDIIDGLAFLNAKEINFNSGKDLAEQALLYSQKCLSLSQISRFTTYVTSLGENDLNNAYESVRSNVSDLHTLSDSLFSSIYFISTERKKIEEETKKFTKNFVLIKFLPVIETMHYIDFNFSVRDVFEAKEIIPRIFKAIEKHITPMNFSPHIKMTISRSLFGSYFNSIDRLLNFQEKAVKNVDSTFQKFISENGKLHDELSVTHKALFDRSVKIFNSVKNSNDPTMNMDIVLDGMHLVKNLQPKVVALALAKANNPNIIGFHNFMRSYMLENKMIMDVMFDSQEAKLIQLFHNSALSIRQ